MLGKEVHERIRESWTQVQSWKAAHKGALVHFEFASTQDTAVRKALGLSQLEPMTTK